MITSTRPKVVIHLRTQKDVTETADAIRKALEHIPMNDENRYDRLLLRSLLTCVTGKP